jgi:hypothetical protein
MIQTILARNNASFLNSIVFASEINFKTMETKTEKIPAIQKSKIELKEKVESATSSCCTPKNKESICCTPSQANEENEGACCAQPADGSTCCDK